MFFAPIIAAAIWTCSVRLLPDYNPKANAPDVGEGVTYLYVGDRRLHTNYGADALFTAPLDGRSAWYDAGVHFGPLDNENVTAQLEISRWERFNYRPHIALAWALPKSRTVEYKDLDLFVDDGNPHRLGIYVNRGRLQMVVDGRTICSANAALFVTPSERKYFQMRTETASMGRNSDATVAQVRLKRDSDLMPGPFRSDCVMHRNGIFWSEISANRFAARGAFYPNEGTFFTGAIAVSPCKT